MKHNICPTCGRAKPGIVELPRANTKIAQAMVAKRRKGFLGVRQAAKVIGVNPTTISFVERGKTPSLQTAIKIAEWLNTPIEDLL